MIDNPFELPLPWKEKPARDPRSGARTFKQKAERSATPIQTFE
jgi:hypothetical protein